MELNWETFHSAYTNAPQEVKDVIDSEKIADCIEAQVGIGAIDSGQQKDVLLVVSHYLLEIVSDIEAMGYLTKLGIPNANVILEHILECVTANLAPPAPAQAATPQQEAIEPVPAVAPTHQIRPLSAHAPTQTAVHPPAPAPPQPPAPQPTATAAPVADLPTQAPSDTRWESEAPVYSSSQTALMREAQQNIPPLSHPDHTQQS